jgi:3-hydroxy-9,10-secoandrosta-1,3,5(10)-triene-9,17-dione monooxygenase reductase component
MQVDERTFRLACGHFATGVSIVTILDTDGQRHGLTANSFTSVSLDPPLILVCVDKRIATYPVMERAEGWLVNILADDQEELSRRFATPDIDKFQGMETAEGPFGAPRIAGSIAYLGVRAHERHDGGDHGIFVGEVTDVEFTEGDPLVFYKGMYGLPDAMRVPPVP